jgi:hypothetical protein
MAGRYLRLGFAAMLSLASVYAREASASPADTKRAYDQARLCYVANGNIYAEFKKTGDTANAKLFDTRAHQAYDLAYFYGNMLKLGKEQVGADLQATTDKELPKLVKDSVYFTAVAKDCKSVGLM